jgi:tetratricopeptide (TPR) repeat protein
MHQFTTHAGLAKAIVAGPSPDHALAVCADAYAEKVAWSSLSSEVQDQKRAQLEKRVAKHLVRQSEACAVSAMTNLSVVLDRLPHDRVAPDDDPLTQARTDAGKRHWDEAAGYFDEALLLPNVPLSQVHVGRAEAYVELSKKLFHKAFYAWRAHESLVILLDGDANHAVAAALRLTLVDTCPKYVQASDLFWAITRAPLDVVPKLVKELDRRPFEPAYVAAYRAGVELLYNQAMSLIESSARREACRLLAHSKRAITLLVKDPDQANDFVVASKRAFCSHVIQRLRFGPSNFRKAMVRYQRAASLVPLNSPEYAWALHGIGTIYHERAYNGSPVELEKLRNNSIAAYDKAVAICPDDWRFKRNRKRAHELRVFVEGAGKERVEYLVGQGPDLLAPEAVPNPNGFVYGLLAGSVRNPPSSGIGR